MRSTNTPKMIVTRLLNSLMIAAVVTASANVVSAVTSCTTGFLNVQTPIAVASGARSVAFGDFNRDGIQDVITPGSGQVHVRLGDGAGGYGPSISTSVGVGPAVVVAADFNKDARLDFAVTNLADGTISIGHGNGDGTFAIQPALTTGGNPEGLVAADFNIDGKIDLAAAYLDAGPGGVKVFYGNSSGFDAPISVIVGASPRLLAAADMEKDGMTDLIVSYDNPTPGAGKITVKYKSLGGLGFPGSVDYPVGDYASTFALGDINNDKFLDIVTANFTGNSVSVVKSVDPQNGIYATTHIPVGFFPEPITVGDFNQDGFADIVVANSTSSKLLLGDGTGAFSVGSSILLGATPTSLGVSDYNSDAKPDLIAVSSGSISVLQNSCPLYSGSISGLISGGQTSLTGEVVDCGSSSKITSGISSAISATAESLSESTCVTSSTGVRIDVDATSPSLTGTFISVLDTISLTTSSGTTATTTSTSPRSVIISTGVVRPPALVEGGPQNVIDLYELKLKFFRKNLAGDFEEKASMVIDNEIISEKSGDLKQGDVDADGFADFLVVDTDSNAVKIVKVLDAGGVSPSFANVASVTVGQRPIQVLVADFNKDGLDDFVTLNELSKTVTVALTLPSYLENSFDIGVGGGGGSGDVNVAEIADVNQDGNMDILVGTTTDVKLLEGTGSGSFSTAKTLSSAGESVKGIKLADMNVDAKLDVVLVTENTGTLAKSIKTIFNTAVAGSSFTGVLGGSTGAPTDSGKFAIKKLPGDSQPDVVIKDKAAGELKFLKGTNYAAPLAIDDAFHVDHGSGLNGSVIGNDNYPVDVTVSAVLVDAPANSAGFSLNANGSFNYTATSFNAGEDSFTYKLNDGTSDSPTATVYISIGDVTPPVITPTIIGSLGNNGWYVSNVDISWSVVDNETAISNQTGCGPVSVVADTAGVTYTCEATSSGGTASSPVTVKRDATAPVVTSSVSPNPVLLGGSATASAIVSDGMSGVFGSATCGSPDTSSVGFKTLSCSATDNAGNVGSDDVTYQVIYDFSGFFNPVDNLPFINEVRAGQNVPIRFSLAGFQGMGIIAPGFPIASTVACNASEPSSTVEETSGPGASDLTYDVATDRYQYNWKTKKGDKGTCQLLVIQLIDGTVHMAKFRLK